MAICPKEINYLLFCPSYADKVKILILLNKCRIPYSSHEFLSYLPPRKIESSTVRCSMLQSLDSTRPASLIRWLWDLCSSVPPRLPQKDLFHSFAFEWKVKSDRGKLEHRSSGCCWKEGGRRIEGDTIWSQQVFPCQCCQCSLQKAIFGDISSLVSTSIRLTILWTLQSPHLRFCFLLDLAG